MLTVTTAAPDLQLLTTEEMRSEAGITGSGQDDELESFGLQIAAAITTHCNVAIGGGAPPTLRRETLNEVIRAVDVDTLILSRRHEINILSVSADGVILDASDYEADPESGLLSRYRDDRPCRWRCRKVTIAYEAGFEDVPDELRAAARSFFRLAWLESKRDPALKELVTDVPGVLREEKTWWIGSVPGQSTDAVVPDIVAGALSRFRNFRK